MRAQQVFIVGRQADWLLVLVVVIVRVLLAERVLKRVLGLADHFAASQLVDALQKLFTVQVVGHGNLVCIHLYSTVFQNRYFYFVHGF